MKFFLKLLLLSNALVAFCPVFSQTNTYILNGSASQNTCNCYTLTPAVNTKSGSVWNATKINLNNPFDFVFNVYLGCLDSNGADGIVFMLQPISTSVGTTGEGMGFEGISPSIGISLDTWRNASRNDPAFDHITIQANGNVTHVNDLAGPVQAAAGTDNIEDCQWHTFRIAWDPVTRDLSTYFDGVFRLRATVDLVTAIFNNDPFVYWGFSAGTGGSNNLQQFCTALNPRFNSNLSANDTCLGAPAIFFNESESFAPIAAYHWDLGDGTTSTLAIPPAHTYSSPGNYTVKLAITGLDGCKSDTTRKTITIGDYPLAGFKVYDTCAGTAPRVKDLSTLQVGTVSQWNWSLDGQPVSVSQQPQFPNLATGPHELELTVTSNHGCSSGSVSEQFIIKPKPLIEASGGNECVTDPVSFIGQQIDNATLISQWNWAFGDNQASFLQNPQHNYSTGGNFTALVFAIADNGCASDVKQVPVTIYQAIANAGPDTIIIKDEPFQLQGSGGNFYSWSPSTGLNDATLQNPTTVLQDDIRYTVTVTTAEGCVDEDEINITVFKGSAIYVPNGFTPNNDGLNDRLKPYYIGIRTLDFFQVYNRWGELLFSTKDLGAGWNGMYKGQEQPTGTFVWILKATDFVGKVYQLKGTSTIIR
jgi:gliding motility-associated-like protein